MAKENRPEIANSSIAASVRLSQMLKLGKVIVPEVDIVTLPLQEFFLKEMRWLELFQATFSLERKSFASGGFRDAYLAKAISGIAKGKYVLKKYKENKVKEIKELFGTMEAYTRYVVQMNALAITLHRIWTCKGQSWNMDQLLSTQRCTTHLSTGICDFRGLY